MRLFAADSQTMIFLYSKPHNVFQPYSEEKPKFHNGWQHTNALGPPPLTCLSLSLHTFLAPRWPCCPFQPLRLACISCLLHLLFPLPRMLLTFFKFLLKCHHLSEAFPDKHIVNCKHTTHIIPHTPHSSPLTFLHSSTYLNLPNCYFTYWCSCIV